MSNQLISEQKDLIKVCDAINTCSVIGVDTEFLREKTYYAKLCLVQIAAGSDSWCIDVLALEDLSPLTEVFENESLLKVFHSSRQDFEVIYQQFGCLPKPIFDTQIAAGFCGADAQAGYATVLKSEFSIELDKSQTRTDWSRRPLSNEQIEYAINDVLYLEALYKHYKLKLEQLNHAEWFDQELQTLFNLDDYQMLPQNAYKRLNGSSFSKASQYFLRELANWRESLAQNKNIPRSWVLKDKEVYELAEILPESEEEMKQTHIGKQSFVRKNTQHILQLANKNKNLNDVDSLWETYQPFDAEQKTVVKGIMKKIAEIAKTEEIAQTILATRKEVEMFVRDQDRSIISKGWRADFLLEKLKK